MRNLVQNIVAAGLLVALITIILVKRRPVLRRILKITAATCVIAIMVALLSGNSSQSANAAELTATPATDDPFVQLLEARNPSPQRNIALWPDSTPDITSIAMREPSNAAYDSILIDTALDESRNFAALQVSYHHAPLQIYEWLDGAFTEVDYITDDFEEEPERWLYVLQPDHDYYVVMDARACEQPWTPDYSANYCAYSQYIRDTDIGSIAFYSYTDRPAEFTSLYLAQCKFVADGGDVALYYEDYGALPDDGEAIIKQVPVISDLAELIPDNCGYGGGWIYIKLHAAPGTASFPTRSVSYGTIDNLEQPDGDPTDEPQVFRLTVTGTPDGTCEPIDMDADAYLWPSHDPAKEAHSIIEFINSANSFPTSATGN